MILVLFRGKAGEEKWHSTASEPIGVYESYSCITENEIQIEKKAAESGRLQQKHSLTQMCKKNMRHQDAEDFWTVHLEKTRRGNICNGCYQINTYVCI